MKRHALRYASVLLPATALVPAAFALDASVSADYRGEYTTNASRVSDEEVDEWIHRPGISASASHDVDTVSLDANYRVSRRIYQDDTFDSDTIASGGGGVTWNAIPDRLSFFANNQRTYTTRNSEAAETPDNQQTVAFTNAGTNLTLDSIGSHQIQLGYTYGITNAEETRTDSQRHTGSVSYIVPLSPARQVSLSGSYTDVDFDEETSPDYETRSATLNYSSSTRVLDFALSAGKQFTERELARDDVDGFIGSLDVTYFLRESTSISLSASQSIRDNFDAGARGIIDFVDDLPDRTDTNEVYTEDRVSLTYSTTAGRNDFSISGYGSRRDYEADVDDEERIGASIAVGRRLTPTSSVNLEASYEDRTFAEDRDDEFIRASLSYSNSPWRRFSWSIGARYAERTSDTTTVSYDEWLGYVSLSYLLYGR